MGYGTITSYALMSLEPRGTLFVTPGMEVSANIISCHLGRTEQWCFFIKYLASYYRYFAYFAELHIFGHQRRFVFMQLLGKVVQTGWPRISFGVKFQEGEKWRTISEIVNGGLVCFLYIWLKILTVTVSQIQTQIHKIYRWKYQQGGFELKIYKHPSIYVQ